MAVLSFVIIIFQKVFWIFDVFKASCINVVAKLPGIKPTSILDQENTILSKTIDITVEKYSSHASVTRIGNILRTLILSPSKM